MSLSDIHQADRQQTDLLTLRLYEDTRDEWMHVETILKQRADKSKPTLSSTGSSGSTADDMVTPLPIGDHVTKQPFDRQLSNLSNEVSV